MSGGTLSELNHDPLAVASALGIEWSDARQRVMTRLAAYVAQETPSGHPELLAPLAGMIAADLHAAGARVTAHEAPGLGTNLVAELPGREREAPVLLLAHIDTVHPPGAFGAGALRIENGSAIGPGVVDMKGGVALLVEALTLFAERNRLPRRPVQFLVTCDEEIGSHSSRALIETHARAAGAVLVPEPCMPDGGVKTGRKGVATYRLEVRGVAAHAGVEPGVGASATHELARQMLDVFALAHHDRGTTINIGMVGAGSATNVVPDRAWATVDVRLADSAEGDRVDGALSGLRVYDARTSVSATRTEFRPPLVRSPAVVALYQHARELATRLGCELGEGATGGGSDGSIAAAAGAGVLDGLGPRGGGAHTLHEHIIIDDLPFRLALLYQLIDTL